MSEEIKSIKKWFELAKPEPTIEDACVQIRPLQARYKDL